MNSLCKIIRKAACLIVVCTLLPVALRGQPEPLWQTLYSVQSRSSIYVIGTVHAVRGGTVKPGDFLQQTPADILFSMGVGTLSSPEEMGEMLTLSGTANVKSVDSSRGYRTESSKAVLKTPFSFGLQKGSKPAEILRVQSTQGITVEDVFRTISARHGRAIAVFGIGNFSTLKASAIKRAPIFGEPIYTAEHSERYYHPVDSLRNHSGVFFGIVLNTERPQPVGYADSLEGRMLYVNYADSSRSPVQSHAHVLVSPEIRKLSSLKKPEEIIKAAQSYRVKDVQHLLTQSILVDGLFMVYDVGGLAPYTPKYWAYWYHKTSQFEELAGRTKGHPVVMLGNSITDGFMTREYLPEYNIVNRGISGDITQGLLDRLESSVIALKPSMLFVMIGTNDIARGLSDSLILANYEWLIDEVITGSPKTKIVVEAILPTRNHSERPNGRIDTLNQKLRELAARHLATYLDLHTLFQDRDGNLREDYSVDGLHLNGAAYTIWARELRRIISGQKK